MSSFIVDLWESIFIPGPTSSLVLATNVSFACLQLVFLVLLISTYSVHFVILSIICAGLWWGINWFVAEVNALKAQEQEEKEQKKNSDKQEEDGAEEKEAEGVAKSTSESKAAKSGRKRGSKKNTAD